MVHNGLHFPVPTPSWFQVSTPCPKSDQIMKVSLVHQFTNWFWIASCCQLEHSWRELEIEFGSLDPLAVKHGNSPPVCRCFSCLRCVFLALPCRSTEIPRVEGSIPIGHRLVHSRHSIEWPVFDDKKSPRNHGILEVPDNLFYEPIVISHIKWLVGGDWNMAFIFPYTVFGIIIPTDFHIFQRGSNHQSDGDVMGTKQPPEYH